MFRIRRNRSVLLLGLYIFVLLAATFWPFNFLQENELFWEPGGGLRFAEHSVAYTESAINGLEGLTDFTLLLNFSTDIRGRISWILSYGLDFDRTNLLIGSYANQLIVEVHRGRQVQRTAVRNVLEQEQPTWLTLVVRGGRSFVYLDGELKGEGSGNLSPGLAWQTSYPLIIGSRGDGKYPWVGVIYRLAFLPFAASDSAIAAPDELIRDGNPVVEFDFRLGEGSLVFSSGSAETGPLILPRRWTPFQRSVLLDIEELWTPFPIWSDIVLNVLAFVPVGFLIGMTIRKKMKPASVLLLAVIGSFGLSLCIEVLQAFVPMRWSTFTDVTTNTFGGFAGGLLWITVMFRSEGRSMPAGSDQSESEQKGGLQSHGEQ